MTALLEYIELCNAEDLVDNLGILRVVCLRDTILQPALVYGPTSSNLIGQIYSEGSHQQSVIMLLNKLRDTYMCVE